MNAKDFIRVGIAPVAAQCLKLLSQFMRPERPAILQPRVKRVCERRPGFAAAMISKPCRGDTIKTFQRSVISPLQGLNHCGYFTQGCASLCPGLLYFAPLGL